MRHRLEHDRARGNARAVADLDVAEDLGAGADEDAIADFRMPVSRLFSGPSERYAVQHGDIILNDGGLPDHEPRRVVDENAAPDASVGVDVALEHGGGTALQIEGK